MGVIADLILIVFILGSIFLGFKKGLISSLIKIVSFFIAIILAFMLCAPVGNYLIENTQIDDKIQITIEEALSSKDLEQMEEQDPDQSNMPEVITDYIAKQVKEVTSTTQNEVAKTVAKNVTVTIINGIAFIGIFLVVRIVLVVFRKVADKFAQIPLLKQVNELRRSCLWFIKGTICDIFGACYYIITCTIDFRNICNPSN